MSIKITPEMHAALCRSMKDYFSAERCEAAEKFMADCRKDPEYQRLLQEMADESLRDAPCSDVRH